MKTGYDYSWFVLTQKIIEREFALSGSEQNPDLTSKSMRQVLASRIGKGAPAPASLNERSAPGIAKWPTPTQRTSRSPRSTERAAVCPTGCVASPARYRALEGTFLGGCLFSGRTAGRAGAQAVG